MANPDHVAIIQKGVEKWNEWRKKHHDVTPDLSRYDFSGSSLGEANLSAADLSEANLAKANLNASDLSEANLAKANLNAADLSEANLTKANLSYSNQSNANLTGANFSGAELKNTDFKKSMMGFCIFGDVDLSNARGLDSVSHVAPSTIGIDSLYKSQGNIPNIFLVNHQNKYHL